MTSALSIGDVPLTQFGQGLNGVWLTTDPDPLGHGLGEAREMTDTEREGVRKWKGELPAPGTRWPDKREVRIRVKLPTGDRKLKHWFTWSQGRMDEGFRDALIKHGGGTRKAKSWYVYFGEILPYQFTEVLDLDERAVVQTKVNKLNQRLSGSG